MATPDLVQRKKDLQKSLGTFPVVVIETFMNWGQTQTMKVLSVKPKTVEEVQKVVKAAVDNKLKIRCVGDAHSWSPLFPDEGDILMYIENLVTSSKERIRLNEPEKDGDAITVTIVPGVSTGELSDFFTKNNVCLMSDVILDKVMYGGVIATGCHGVGKDQKSVSDDVVGMTLVLGNSEVKTYNFSDLPTGNDPDFYNSLKCNLGLFGIMTDITLKVEPIVVVETVNDFSCTVEDIFYNPDALKKLYEENWSVEVFWFPFNSMSWFETLLATQFPIISWQAKKDNLWIRKINVREVPSQSCLTATDYGYKEAKDLVSTTFGRMISNGLNQQPRFVPSFMKAGFEMVKRFNEESIFEYINKAIHYQNFIEVFPVVDMEFAFNVDETFEDQAKAMQVVVEQCESLAKLEKCPEFPLSVAMEMRWMASSEALLCPARAASSKDVGGSGKTLYLEVLGIANQPDQIWENFTREIANQWKQITPGGMSPVPHWAKQWSYLPDIIPYVHETYGEAMTIFKQQLTEGGEGYSVFLNETLKQVFFSPVKVKQPDTENPKEPKPKPKPKPEPKSEDVEFASWTKFSFEEKCLKSWKELWESIGEQVWTFPNATPRPNIERQFKFSQGLIEELMKPTEMSSHPLVDRFMVNHLFKDE